MSNQVSYQIGDEVVWKQQRGGREMRGRIVCVVPPHRDPVLTYGAGNLVKLKVQFSAKLRDHVSYLCVYPGTKGSKGQDNLAWPRVSTMQKADA